MGPIRMVHLLTVGGAFQAKVISARLGAVGIVTSLSGGVDGPYPFGDVQVLVDESDLELAQQLLLADQVEAVYEGRPGWGRRERSSGSRLRSLVLHPWVAVAVIVFLAVISSLVRVLSF